MNERRRKLKFRAWRRGFREMDMLVGAFADENIDSFNEAELDEFEAILNVPDWEVYAWLIGQKDIPPENNGPVMQRLVKHRHTTQGG
ncbi:MAG: succinate dehydrogenase assembly factor 2 [Hyphomonas sp.]